MKKEIVLTAVNHQHLEKGARKVMRSAEELVRSDPMGFQLRPVSEVHVEWNPDDDKLARLEALYGQRASLAIPLSRHADDEAETYRRTLHLLREAFARPYSPWERCGVKMAIYDWLERIPREFLDLLGERRPKALILLAHIACLLKRAEQYWYINGAGERIVKTVVNLLDEDLMGWIRWPLAIVGIRTSS